MKIVFMGTPDFAVPALEKLIKAHEVICVYTRAPRQAGRGQKLCKSPVHVLAESHGIEVRTPKTLRDENEQKAFAGLGADVAIVAAYGLILPRNVIKAFPFGCLNIHASLLPRWRGAAPIQRSIEAGDIQSGVTIMEVVEALDAGRMYQKAIVNITPTMTGGELHDKLSFLGADLLIEVLANLDRIAPVEQDEKQVTYAAKLDKSEALVDFNFPADQLERKVRAFNPFPGAYFTYQGERFKVLKAEVAAGAEIPGKIISSDGELIIACGKDALKITKIQRQGKQAMPIGEFLKGFSFETGSSLI